MPRGRLADQLRQRLPLRAAAQPDFSAERGRLLALQVAHAPTQRQQKRRPRTATTPRALKAAARARRQWGPSQWAQKQPAAGRAELQHRFGLPRGDAARIPLAGPPAGTNRSRASTATHAQSGSPAGA